MKIIRRIQSYELTFTGGYAVFAVMCIIATLLGGAVQVIKIVQNN